MTKVLSVAGALAALTLAACGGGGSSSSSIPATATPPTTIVRTLKGGYSRASGALSNERRALDFSGSIQPGATFGVPDSYLILQPARLLGYYAVAYYDTASAPTTLPTVTWTQTGLPIPLSAHANDSVQGQVIVGEQTVAPPATDGKGTLTGTASNGDVVNLTYLAYRTGDMSIQPPGHRSTDNDCANFSPLTMTSTPAIGTGDICLVDNGNTTSKIVMKNGGVFVPKTIDAVSAVDYSALPTTSTTIPTVQFAPRTCDATVVFRASSGAIVKFQPFACFGDVINGNLTEFFGFYRITVGAAAFDF